MNHNIVEQSLKSLLQNNIKIISRKRVLGTGQLLLYELKDFNIRLIFSSGKKVELLYPFKVTYGSNIVYYDYQLNHIHKDDIVLKAKVNRMIKNHKNKYCDLILSIDILK